MVVEMKRLAVILILLALAGCATERHYSDYLADGRNYYDYPDLHLGYARGYGHDRLFMYGVYPWWTYDFYSPYFYPYTFTYYHPFYDPFYGRWFFAGWSAAWPYYGGYYGRYGWAAVPYRQPPVSPTDRDGHYRPGGPDDGGSLIVDDPRRRALGGRGYNRETMYRRPSKMQPGMTKPAGGVVAPVRKAAPYGNARQIYGGTKARSPAVPRRPDVAVPRASMPAAAPRVPSGAPRTVTPAARFDRSGASASRAHRDR
jgi:hypothetical protein